MSSQTQVSLLGYIQALRRDLREGLLEPPGEPQPALRGPLSTLIKMSLKAQAPSNRKLAKLSSSVTKYDLRDHEPEAEREADFRNVLDVPPNVSVKHGVMLSRNTSR